MTLYIAVFIISCVSAFPDPSNYLNITPTSGSNIQFGGTIITGNNGCFSSSGDMGQRIEFFYKEKPAEKALEQGARVFKINRRLYVEELHRIEEKSYHVDSSKVEVK